MKKSIYFVSKHWRNLIFFNAISITFYTWNIIYLSFVLKHNTNKIFNKYLKFVWDEIKTFNLLVFSEITLIIIKIIIILL